MKKFLSLIIAITFGYGFELGKLGNFEFKHLNKNVYIMHGPIMKPSIENRGFMNNPAFIESKKGLIVIDPGGNYNIGKEVLKEIEKVNKKPVLAIFNTHKHGDHWFANIAFLKKYPKVKIYAHPQMIKEVKDKEAIKWYNILEKLTHNLKGTKPFAFPNTPIKDNEIIEIDGEKFKITHPKSAHTNSDIIIHHINSNTIFLGDNVMKGRLGMFDSSSSILENINLLEKIKKTTNATIYVPGHGISGKKDEVINPYLNYLKTLKKYAQKAYNEDKESYEVAKEMLNELKSYHKWDDFKVMAPKHLQKVYLEIEEKDMQ